ncbi:DUF4365 domain-containing protein [uncultured Aquimarina sp.]|uniref:DUF4365 domain-containing protein n=1 Tax=uncultured Aquimarina sp. TaxID=575652 RepID=UPI002601B150|nr:DUF4365 domain-containing protein [uncultured Aquimarina sp.]
MTRYNPTERIGVNATENIFISEFEWIFREQTIVDVGIDALVEQSENGNPKGKFLALQIKTGKGNFHFSEKKITHYISNVHYNYWLNFDIPIVLIAHIPESNETFWMEINESTMKRTKKKWKLEIPKSSKLNRKAKPILTKLLVNKRIGLSTVQIFNGENINDQTIYDIAEKSKCIVDANESTSKTSELLNEMEQKTIETNEKIKEYNSINKSFNSPDVKASINGYAKTLNIYARRFENENLIFSETFAEGVFGFEQAIMIHFFVTKDVEKLKSSLNSIIRVPNSLENLIISFEKLGSNLKSLPQKNNSLKEAKKNILLVIDSMVDEYKAAKSMVLSLIESIENELKNNC